MDIFHIFICKVKVSSGAPIYNGVAAIAGNGVDAVSNFKGNIFIKATGGEAEKIRRVGISVHDGNDLFGHHHHRWPII